jgi:hypothetical protein
MCIAFVFRYRDYVFSGFDWYAKTKIQYNGEISKSDKDEMEKILLSQSGVRKAIEYGNQIEVTGLGSQKCSNAESNIIQVKYNHPFAGNNTSKYALNSKNQYVTCYFQGTAEPRNMVVD